MKKIFLISLMALTCAVTAWAGNVGTLEELQAALEAGGDITLTEDINAGATELVSAAESTTLDLNGHTLCGARFDQYAGIIKVAAGSLTINATNGGTISAGTYVEGVCCLNAVWVDGGVLTINAGTFVGSFEAIYGTSGTINLIDGTYTSSNDNAVWAKGAELNIEGGTYDGSWYDVQADYGTTASISGGTFVGDNDGSIATCGTAGTIGISGGIFNGGIYNTASSTITITGGKFKTKPAKSYYNSNDYEMALSNGYYSLVLAADIPVLYAAKNNVTNQYYSTLAAAIADADDYQTILLVRDNEEVISIAKNVIIDLNGKTCTGVTAGEGYTMLQNSHNDSNVILVFTGNNPRVELNYAGLASPLVFTTIQDAFAALPANSTPATVTVMSDLFVEYATNPMLITLEKFHNATLDLNGHTVYATTPYIAASTSLIDNKGTLTIKDGTATQENPVGTGRLLNYAANVDQWQAANREYPIYYNNAITNHGRLIIESGRIENLSSAGACYVIDNQSNGNAYSPEIIINGGYLKSEKDFAIRQCLNSTTQPNSLIINGGVVEGTRAVWMHLPSSDKKISQIGSFTMNGGTLRSTGSEAYYTYSYGSKLDKVNVTITGGDIYGKFLLSGGWSATSTHENVSISGGNFYINNSTWGIYSYYTASSFKFLSGGKLQLKYAQFDGSYMYPFLKTGYCGFAVENDANWTEILPCNSRVVTEDKTMAEVAAEIETAGEEVAASIIVIDATSEEDHAVVTVTQDIAVEGIVIVPAENEGEKEGQIVVESGVTLTVGNSGIVSENDELTTVVVKPGGTVIVGNGGVTQDGQATPVEIQSTGTESGVFMVDPNAPDSVAEAPAKVKVYTRAHKDNGIEYWQQMASPVKGDRNNDNKIIVTPLGELQGNHNFLTSVYNWDYATDSWVRITDGMEEISEGVYAFRGDAVWTTTDDVLKPFAAIDLINNSHASHGGVTYEFAGELVGNGDMVLNFPESGFCTFGNSYTAPIDLSTLFAKITNDMDQANIDPCVYMYNSTADRFESVNSLGLWLKELGIMDVAFSQIPPQQAFVMNLLSGNSAQSAVDYATCVWGNPNTNKNTPILAPKRQQAATFSALLNIIVSDGEATDRVVLVEDEKYSAAYDNGADAQKYMQGAFNIYAVTEAGKLAMVAADDIENTELSFKAGNAVNYTMNFNNVEGDYVLVDRLNNAQVAMTEGGTYVFAAQPNSTMEGRFAIVPAAKMPTAIENTEVKANVKGIYTIMGQYLGEDFDVLPAGVYVIDGVKIVK